MIPIDMDPAITKIFAEIQELTRDWPKLTSGIEAYHTSLDEALKKKVTGCGMKARMARRRLMELGYKVEIVRGYYLSPRGWNLHAWVRVNGTGYDPSRKDFVLTPQHSLACPDAKIRKWEQIIDDGGALDSD